MLLAKKNRVVKIVTFGTVTPQTHVSSLHDKYYTL